MVEGRGLGLSLLVPLRDEAVVVLRDLVRQRQSLVEVIGLCQHGFGWKQFR